MKNLVINDDAITKESFIDKLFPNPWDALAVFLAFVILLIVVFYFAYKPLKKLIQKRADYVDGKLRNAEQSEKDALAKVEEAKLEVKNSHQEALAIVEQAKVDAEQERIRIKEKGKEEADQEVKRAKLEIEQEIEKSKDEIHSQIVDVAFDASKKVLSREVKDKDNEKLINQFIEDLKKKE